MGNDALFFNAIMHAALQSIGATRLHSCTANVWVIELPSLDLPLLEANVDAQAVAALFPPCVHVWLMCYSTILRPEPSCVGHIIM